MTQDEWDEITVVMLAYWPNREIPSESFDVWFLDLSEFEAEFVESAVRALGRDGREWMPTGGQIRQKILDLRSGTADWSAAYELAMQAATSGGGAEYGGLSWLRDRDPVAADVAEAYGWRDFCLSDTSDGTRRAQFREMFALRADKAAQRELYRGLPGGLKVIDQANEKPRRIGEMFQLDSGEEAA